MQVITKGYRGLELLCVLNFDRVAVMIALGASLYLAAYLGTPN